MRPCVTILLLVLAVSCRGTTTDQDDIATSKDSALATFLQPLEARLRDDQSAPERRSRELSYFGTGYSYHPYGGHHNPLYSSPYGQQALYNPYSNPSYSFGGLNGGYGGATGAFLGSGFGGGYPAGVQQQFGYGGFGQGAGAYPYSAGWNAVGQSPYGGYGSQLVGGGYYNRGGLYV